MTAAAPTCYEEIELARDTISPGTDALTLVRRLVLGGRTGGCLMYERDGVWLVALGILGEIRLEAEEVIRR